MNDRHLFRGKRTDNGEWVTGAYLERYHSTRFGIVDAIFFSDEAKTHRHPVNRDTVGQCTGMRDNRGLLIFEGDALRRSGKKSKIYIVCWNEYYWVLRCGSVSENLLMNRGGIDGQEIIGNIHDKPELLEAGDIL